MEDIINYFTGEGYEVIVGWKDKKRKEIIGEAMKKLKESGDENKIKYAKELVRYYFILHNIGYILNPPLSLEDDKYGLNYLCSYLDGFIDTSKLCITDVIKALGNDEPVNPFCKYLMFTHMYTPEQVKEIGHEEIYRREQKFKEDVKQDELPVIEIINMNG